jgi:phosphonate transport system substrate-binding protein
VAVGAIDSPQATLLPLAFLRARGLEPTTDFTVERHDVLGGKHGDHIGGERDAARALIAGKADAACMIDGNHRLFVSEGTLPSGATRVLARTPRYDHCNLTVGPSAPADLVARFRELVLAMSYADPEVRPLLDLEGLKEWREGRVEGYESLDAAVDALGFYDRDGRITCAEYRY